MPRLYGRFQTGVGQPPVLGRGGPINAYEPQAEMVDNMKVGDLVPAGLPEIEYFRLLKNGTTAAVANQLQEGQTLFDLYQPNNSRPQASRVGTNKVTFTIFANYVKDYFAGGTLMLINGGVPHVYPIVSNTAVTGTSPGSGKRITITIDGVLLAAVTNTTYATILESEYNRCRQGTVSAYPAVGVPLVAVPANNYYLGVAKGRVALKITNNTGIVNVDKVLVSKGASGQVTLLDEDADSTDQREVIGKIYYQHSSAAFNNWIMVDIDLT